MYDARIQHEDRACVTAQGGGSEDCLYLDVYMPVVISKAPVMFWIHGGSWMSGSKNEYSLKFWAKHEWVEGLGKTVGVAANYRMNMLGFPDLAGVPLNLAMHDHIMALGWVQKHISNFGGDPDLVTIFGESAGSMEILQLWASPNAQPFFARAISQSPYVWSYENGQATPYKTSGFDGDSATVGKPKRTTLFCSCNLAVAIRLEYLRLELTDELISNPSQAVPAACRAICKWQT